MKEFKEYLDGLKVSRWPAFFFALAIAAVVVFNRDDNLAFVLDLMVVAPALLGLSFLESKLLWDSYGKRVGFTLPDDRWASLLLFLGIFLANALIIG